MGMKGHNPHEAGPHPLRDLLLEALDIASPGAVEAVLVMAMVRVDAEEVPRDLQAYADFVEQGILPTVEERLGEEALEAVSERLRPLIARARASGIRSRDPALESGLRRIPKRRTAHRHVILVGGTGRLATLAFGLEARREEVIAVADGQQALVQCREAMPYVLVSEYALRGMAGMQLANLLRRMHGERAPAMVLVGTSHPRTVPESRLTLLGDDATKREVLAAVVGALELEAERRDES